MSLIAQYPTQALKVKSCQEQTDVYTNQYYPGWTDGDRGNAFRHAMWNALMVREIGYYMAQDFATAHENHGLTDEQYAAEEWYGFNGLEHRNMDLYNNYKGRETYNSGDTDNTLIMEIQWLMINEDLTILY